MSTSSDIPPIGQTKGLWTFVPLMLCAVGIGASIYGNRILCGCAFATIAFWALACLGHENTENW